MSMNEFRHFELNRRGLDWAIGDLHGCFGPLQQLLLLIDFQPATDRLFAVGDLVDRGPDSDTVLDWLGLPWFYSVRGNHEQTALDTDLSDETELLFYRSIGGAWFLTTSRSAQEAYRSAFRALPLAIEVATEAGAIGILHADCPLPSWSQFVTALTEGKVAAQVQEHVQWSRDRTLQHNTAGLTDLRTLIVGHTPREAPETLGNVINIDTGAVYGNALTAVCLQTLDTLSVSTSEGRAGAAKTFRG